MKKLIVLMIISTLCSTAVYAESTDYGTDSAQYTQNNINVSGENTQNSTVQNPEQTKRTELNQRTQLIEKKLNNAQDYNFSKKTKKIREKSAKNKNKNQTPKALFDFKILDVQVIPEETRTIERL